MTTTVDRSRAAREAPAPPAPRARRGPRWAWAAVTVLAVLLAAAAPLLWRHRFYFVDDTQLGAYGIWYALGARLSGGDLPPLLLPSLWQGGNVAAEGQWGIWNPVVLGIGLFVHAVSDAVVASSIIKIAMLVTAGLGTYWLALDYRVAPRWAALAGLSAPLGGFTVYMDSTSWVTGLLVWGLLPWFWLGLRRVAEGRSPVTALVFGYLIVTVGYVHGTIGLIFALVGVAVSHLPERRWSAVVRLLGVGAVCGLLAVTVYLPGMLTAEVTNRAQGGVTNSDFLAVDAGALLTGAVATARPELDGYWGWLAPTPLLYLTWLLPLLALVDWRAARPVLRSLSDQLVVLGIVLAFITGPSDVGPLRYPGRMTPYVVLCTVVLTVVLVARAGAALSGRRLALALGLLAASAWAAYSSDPTSAGEQSQAVLLAAVGVVAVWWLLRRRTSLSLAAAPVVALVLTLALVPVRAAAYPSPPFQDLLAPRSASDYQAQLPEAEGDVFVVGSLRATYDAYGDPAVWDESLLANLWLLNPASVQNTYSPVGYARYGAPLCMNHLGETCDEALETLLSPRPTTGLPYVDELSISTLQIYRPVLANTGITAPPAGWHEAGSGERTVTWVRDEPLPPAGGVVWADDGTAVTELSRDDRSVSFRVDAATGGGRVVLSRLAWPGYGVSGGGASLAEATDDVLVTVDVPASAAGDVVTVRFDPPGWAVERATWALALLASVLWTAVGLLLGARSRRSLRRAARAAA